MTAQISDQLILYDDSFDIVGISGGPLFSPETHALRPIMISTACWRGWHADYAVRDGTLVLASLGIGLDEEALAANPTLQGESPHKRKDYSEWFFEPLSLAVPFTGGLLAGRGFIRELYVHMGHHPAWKYEHVVELIFVDGKLETMHNRSEAMARLRSDRAHRDRPTSRASKEAVSKWIEETFSLRYPNFD